VPEALTTALERFTQELHAVRDQLDKERLYRRCTILALIASIAIGVTGYLYQRGEQARIRHAVSVDCPSIRGFATFDLPPTASEFARTLVRNYRASYNGRCADILGPLPPIDPDATKPAPSSSPSPTAGR